MDNESDAVMMLMDLGAYENMLERSSGIEKLTEEELLEKINRDVAVWRAYNDKERAETFDEVMPSFAGREKAPTAPVYVPNEEKAVATPLFGRSSEGREKNQEVSLDSSETTPITINKIPNINAEQEQSASDIVAEEEEEKFYLEPIE